MTKPDVRGERRFGALLRLLPSSFRREYEGQLIAVFRHHRDRRLATHAGLGFGFWWFVVSDICATAWKERRDPIAGREVDSQSKGDGMMRGWLEDFGYSARRLWRAPGFSVTALVILVLGIGVNTAAFSVVNALLFRPPPFPDVEALVDLLQDSEDGQPNATSYPAYEDIARLDGLFTGVSAVNNTESFLEQDGRLTSLFTEYATASYMEVLGLSTSRGRWFDATEDDPDGAPAAVISHRMWRDQMASDPAVVGSTIRIGGSAVTVVGIGPEEFNGGSGPVVIDAWLSISALRPTGAFAGLSLTRRQDHPFWVRARLLPGVTIQEAEAAMSALSAELAATYPTINANRQIHVVPVADIRIHPEIDGDLVPGAALLMAVVGLILLIATLNLANLLLVRTTARAREIAVRLAMGAGRARVTRVVLSEALVLALLGGLGGLAVAMGFVRLLGSGVIDLQIPLSLEIRLDATVLMFALGASLLSGIVFGLVPALRVTSRDLTASLRDEAAVAIGARRRFGLTGLLVAGQVAVSLLLLAVSGVFLESLVRAQGADPGFEWEQAGYAQVSLTPLGIDAAEADVVFGQLQDRLEAAPEIDRATFALQLPGGSFGTTTMLLGSGLGGVDEPAEIPWNMIETDYLDVLGIQLLEGRQFGPEDRGSGIPVLVSEAMAKRFWGRTDVVGETILRESSETPQEIIGVVSDVPVRALGEAPTPIVYWPYGGGGTRRAHLIVTSTGDVGAAAATARRLIRESDPRILITASMTMEEHLGSTLAEERLAGTISAGMGLLALALAVLGVYGVVSFAVSRRKKEVGIRQALGADGSAVVRLFVRDVAAVVGTGGLLGLAIAIPASSMVARTFTGGGSNPAVLALVALFLLMTALAATLIPASSAARGNPSEVLSRE